ncbi:4'-phosphopantetheinyl transferase superfamily protein [Actinoplanes oblitus]|uniref:4'-phosphopantetheinyl transferase superfamily protein n=1 Tax=Actinoplanes oblitus TaxID=3040509 RepID=A0ABY8W5W4_9ACTN|nr:4'-phosphopantetheinyl transferase superfamily protein [Actinoplanes oblitus]WIM92902.1 4'-phosphopantetheinyl transferase superfamily protein [Actinoplanes oblitus]
MEAPRWLAVGEADLPSGTAWLTGAEQARAAGLRFRKRHDEFLLRRLAAKHAVAAILGRPADPATLATIEVGNAPSGAPLVHVDGVPSGLDVSISDRAGWAICLAGPGVGCDLELVEPRTPGFVRDFLTEAEQRLVTGLPPGDARDAVANLIWSAKESALKVLRTGLRRDTREVEVTVPGPPGAGWAPISVRESGGATFPGWCRRSGSFLITVVGREPAPPPIALAGPDPLAGASPRHSWVDRPLR